jgi:hypothetical protein
VGEDREQNSVGYVWLELVWEGLSSRLESAQCALEALGKGVVPLGWVCFSELFLPKPDLSSRSPFVCVGAEADIEREVMVSPG